MFRKNTIYIYTDGSSLPKPRRGGIGIRYVYLENNEEEIRIDLEEYGYQSATNNQMELEAVIYGLKKLHQQNIPIKFNLIEVRSDSQYITSNINNAKYSWSKSHWKNKFGKPIENGTLWKELISLIGKAHCKVDLVWVKGHGRDADNKAMDKSAKQSALSNLGPPIVPIKIRRKFTHQKTLRGSIEMKGQKVKIHIITEAFMKLPKLSKYRCEVISKRSKYFGCVDFIYSELHHLKAGHKYYVKLNTDNNNPRILKMIEEIDRTSHRIFTNY
jgi:ribonuclease HI